jgi:hypothetical protein
MMPSHPATSNSAAASVPHLRLALQSCVQLLHCGLELAHALTTTNKQDGRQVRQQALAGTKSRRSNNRCSKKW